MTFTIGMISVDCTDATTLATWWAEQTGGRIVQENEGWFVVVELPDGQPRLGFQKVEAPTPGKNRVHLDVAADELDAEVSRLVAAGASGRDEHTMGDFRWVTLADPEGNLFCVAGKH